jgi:hypothetical protein
MTPGAVVDVNCKKARCSGDADAAWDSEEAAAKAASGAAVAAFVVAAFSSWKASPAAAAPSMLSTPAKGGSDGAGSVASRYQSVEGRGKPAAIVSGDAKWVTVIACKGVLVARDRDDLR